MSKFQKRHTKVGARPGTLVIPHDAEPIVARIMSYDQQRVEEFDNVSLEQIRAARKRPGVTWFDVQGLGDEALLREIAAEFEMHPLALEDVVNTPQRPKLELFEAHAMFITRMVRAPEPTFLIAEQVSVVIGPGFVLTFQERHGDVLDPVRERIRQGKGAIWRHGADYLAYALIDCIVDAYYPVLEHIGEFLEELEERLITKPSHAVLQRLYGVRRELLTLRRAIIPQRDALNSLIRDETPFVTDPVRVFVRDTYDHCVQLIDGVESQRELVAGMMELYLSIIGNRQNQVMKMLTIMASIFIPLSFLAGVYGMNFEYMPELQSRWSYPVLLLAMATVAGTMLLFFRRRGWLGGDEA